MGKRPVPFFRLHDDARTTFEATVRKHPAVDYIRRIDSRDGETLYASTGCSPRAASSSCSLRPRSRSWKTGTADAWNFELRFPSHEALSAFRERCADAGISFEVARVYNPTKPDAGPWFGPTAPSASR